MKRCLTPKSRAAVVVVAFALLAAGSGARPARAEGTRAPHKLGDHPALVVQRLAKQAGYDYASKFYPHPAWLRLYAAPPREAPLEQASARAAPAEEPAADQPAETRVSKR